MEKVVALEAHRPPVEGLLLTCRDLVALPRHPDVTSLFPEEDPSSPVPPPPRFRPVPIDFRARPHDRHQLVRAAGGAHGWRAYLADLESERVGLGRCLAERVRAIWERLETTIGASLSVPSAGPTEGGAFQLAWSTDETYLDIDIESDGAVQWFFKDLGTGEVQGSEDEEQVELGEDLLRLLVRFHTLPKLL